MKCPTLHQFGEALYGPRWQTAIARDLGVSDRTVRRWVAGHTVPPGVYDDLWRLIVERRRTLELMLDRK